MKNTVNAQVTNSGVYELRLITKGVGFLALVTGVLYLRVVVAEELAIIRTGDVALETILLVAFLFAAILGLLLAWRWEGAGGLIALLGGVGLALAACTSYPRESPEVLTATPPVTTPENDQYAVPAAALDAALAFVNEQYGDLAPSPGLHWTGENITPEGLVGVATFRFTAGTCVATVSYPIAAPGAVIYRVLIDERITGFWWEGDVNSNGHVTELDVQGIVSDDPYVGWRTYNNQKFGYSLRFPRELDMMGVDYDSAFLSRTQAAEKIGTFTIGFWLALPLARATRRMTRGMSGGFPLMTFFAPDFAVCHYV